MSTLIATHNFDPPLDDITQVNVYTIAPFDGQEGYDVFDQTGVCLNEGNIFYHIPTREEIEQLIKDQISNH
jgi:hypothetical protein